jgi:hypothetical protein
MLQMMENTESDSSCICHAPEQIQRSSLPLLAELENALGLQIHFLTI